VKQIVLRAYQLARSGKCATFGDIQNQLDAERFHPLSIEEHAAAAVRADIEKLCQEAKGGKR
jgi:hypothetical protein